MTELSIATAVAIPATRASPNPSNTSTRVTREWSSNIRQSVLNDSMIDEGGGSNHFGVSLTRTATSQMPSRAIRSRAGQIQRWIDESRLIGHRRELERHR